MHNTKGFKDDMTGILILAFPLLAALFLTLLITFQSGEIVSDFSRDNARFIVMPRNSYLKTP